MSTGRKALGKGLSALIQPTRTANVGDAYFQCPVGQVAGDPEQPRRRFEETALDELVQSIKEKGVLQPLIVRKADSEGQGGPGSTLPTGVRYIVIAGERRLRAARQAGLTDVPVVVKDVATDEAFELALIENIQREDLDPIEEAIAYERLIDAHRYTQDVLARRLGKSRSAVANSLRLLQLEPELRARVAQGGLTAGHARALLAVPDPDRRLELADRIALEGLSVRAAEALAKALQPKRASKRTAGPASASDTAEALAPHFEQVADDVGTALGAKVVVKSRGRKGRLTIHFESMEDLARLRRILTEASPR